MATKAILCVETQLLTIGVAKNVGLDCHGQVRELDWQFDAIEAAGLRPLWVYSVVVPAYRQYRRLLVDPQRPESISSFLRSVWSADQAMGMPRVMHASSTLLASDRGFARWLEALGIRIETPASVKQIAAVERVAADAAFGATFVYRTGSDVPPVDWSIKSANASLKYYDRFSETDCSRLTSMEQMTFRAWDSRTMRFCEEPALNEDWDATAIRPRSEPKRPAPGLAVDTDDVAENQPVYIHGVKEIVAQWLGGSGSLLKSIGLKRDEFSFWTDGRAHLPVGGFGALAAALNIEYRFDLEDFEVRGGCILKGSTRAAARTAFEVISHGGDLEFGFEILSPGGEVPPMRFFVFKAWGGEATIMLFDRAGPAVRALETDFGALLSRPRRADERVWSDVLRIVEQQAEIPSPPRVVAEFARDHQDWLESCY